MSNKHYHLRLPGPFDRERNIVEIIYYVVRIVYVVVLIISALLVLGGLVA